MAQAEIIDFLKKHNEKEWTSSEIAEALDVCLRNVSVQLSKLIEDNFSEINFRLPTKEEQLTILKFKRYSPLCKIYFHDSFKKGFIPFKVCELKVGLTFSFFYE